MSAAVAARVWERLRALVLENERRREASEALGMSFTRVKALRRIAHQPLTMRKLSEELMSDQPYITVVVDDLERRGLVTRTALATDRRCKLVSVTPAGEAAAATAEQILASPPPSLAALDHADLDELERILARVED